MRKFNAARPVLATLLVLAGVSAADAEDKIKAIATFSILGDFVANVGGDRVLVRTIVGPGGDAHVYQPTPADAADIAKARIVFQNGLGFEGWMERLTKSSGYKGPIVIATKGVTPLKGEEEEHHGEKEHAKEGHHDHDDHDDKHDDHAKHKSGHHEKEADGHHHHGAFDPHAWQSVSNAIVYVKNIRDGLCEVDKEGCETYSKNADSYIGKLKALNTELKAKMEAIPASSRKVITSHDAFGYFGQSYAIEFIAPVGVSTESEASAKDVAAIIDQIKKEKVKALFVENITDTRLIEQIARETGVKIGGTLYSDALSKADGPATTYIKMISHNATLLSSAMAGS